MEYWILDTGMWILESKRVGKHLEMNVSVKNMDHVLIDFLISVFQWNAPKAIINQLNSHQTVSGLVSLT